MPSSDTMSQPEKPAVIDLSTTAPVKNFRPETQHLQYASDEHFDTRICAYNKCDDYLKIMYRTVCADLHVALRGQIKEDYIRAASSDIETVYASCVSSGLSDFDRNTVVDDLIQYIDSKLMVPIADIACLKCPSAHSFFGHVAESYHQRVGRKAAKERNRLGRVRSHAKSENNMYRLFKEAPLLALSEILADSKSSAAIMIILRHSERLHVHVFGEIVEMLQQSDIRAHLVLFNSSKCGFPLRLDKSPRSLLSVTIRGTSAPSEFYDVFMRQIICNTEIPIRFPRKIIHWLHEKFWRSNNCVHSVKNRLLLIFLYSILFMIFVFYLYLSVLFCIFLLFLLLPIFLFFFLL